MTGTPSPQRTCIGCRQRAPQGQLRRLARDERGQVRLGRTLGGRGAWLHPDAACLELARQRRALPRALRVRADELIVDWSGLAQDLAALDATVGGPGD